MAVARWHPVERLRRKWTPDREVLEHVANLDPGTELDSLIRDFFSRIVQQHGPLRINMDGINYGDVRWEIVAGPGGHAEATIWHVPDPVVEAAQMALVLEREARNGTH